MSVSDVCKRLSDIKKDCCSKDCAYRYDGLHSRKIRRERQGNSFLCINFAYTNWEAFDLEERRYH